ncbi:Biorientation of chromosomes in cell division protein 1 [Araneus ventricosus]|uniref:Biorientation of chromosomes in cell division protein 1 n=1 Tax=Araneus ventricosus TaxID=182803 RepID=A0A4Y2P6U1_ARAVE|nr:Biorientation of chromosomes in cell division protein 1 [Araneus ventricosus]
MEKHLVPGDPILIENIVKYLKAKGIFDEFRHECLADVDTKSSCQNLSQRVDGYTTKFLSGEKWHPDLNKNELRNKLRRHIDESGMLAGGADHVVEQVINPKINQLFLPRIIEVVHQYLNEENEKLNKKKESSIDNVNSEKQSSENTDGANKTKSTKLDPIADILSFSYSKPKSNPAQNVQTKVTDSTKAERKKDENVLQTKLSDALPKTEKKKEESINPVKVSEAISKVKKDDAPSDVIQNIEKDKEENVSVKMESVEFVAEPSPAAVLQTKPQSDSKDLIKIKKEVKNEELEASSDPVKKPQKEDIKSEKKKSELEKKKEDSEKKKDDFKPSSDLSSHSEEGSQSKVVPSAPKSSSVVKNKPEAEKSKKVKPHSSSKTSTESQKSKAKDSDKVSSKSSDKLKTSSKVSKSSTKDHPSPHKSSGTSKSSKSDKTEDNNKNKSKDGHSKPSDNSVSKPSSSKSSSIKKESSSAKSKPSFDKTKISKSSDLKPKIKTHIESSEKASKSSLQYSSYDSSQGSDQDKSSTSSSHQKEKHKHFSKHHKKESVYKKSSEKVEKTPDKKRFQSDSDSGTPIKHKHMKHTSEKEKKKSLSIQETAKISSRSNSFGSTSSVSDSPSSSSKETSASTSEETSDNSLKSSEAKKKQGIKDKERCKQTEDFPPPPPPPPTSGISAPGSSSAEVSSMDETQSSQESESDSKLSEDESSSESDVENLYSSNTLKNSSFQSRLKTPEILNDVYDVFLYSSSSSEFEGYSSTPEEGQVKIKQIDDVDVSSVHTSDLSSFDDLLSESECSNSDIDEDRPARRLTIKEAEKLLEEKARQRRLERTKKVLPSKGLLDDKKSNNSPQGFTSVLVSEDELSPIPEPKRESRRERKLNPKYASSEYASIFNSKKTSFITKQVNSNDDKSENVSPTLSETDIHHHKDISPPKRRISMGNLEANQLLDKDVKNSSCAAATLQPFEFSDNAKRKLSFESTEECSLTSEAKTYRNSHERNHNMIWENVESHGSVALKIKKSVIKNDNEINKEPRPQGLKRKLERIEKDNAKKLCRRNSDNSSSSESVPNENNPFNVKSNLKNKDFFHKQKINNNGVVLKMEHVKKKSHPKPNHVIEKQSSD